MTLMTLMAGLGGDGGTEIEGVGTDRVWWKVGFGGDSRGRRKGSGSSTTDSRGRSGSRERSGATIRLPAAALAPSAPPMLSQQQQHGIGIRSMEEMRIEEGRRMYAEKVDRGRREDKGWRSGLGVLRGRM